MRPTANVSFGLASFLGFLQPEGLLFARGALEEGGVVLLQNPSVQQRLLDEILESHPLPGDGRVEATTARFFALAEGLLGLPQSLFRAPTEAETLYLEGDTVAPTFVVPLQDEPTPDAFVPARRGAGSENATRSRRKSDLLFAVEVVPGSWAFDAPRKDLEGANASSQTRLFRWLREKNVPFGLLVNGESLRLCYAPRGETVAHGTFPFAAMAARTNGPLLAGFVELLGASRLFQEAPHQRTDALLARSRAYQATVSTKLAGQVQDALWKLLAGFAEAERDGTKLLDARGAVCRPDYVGSSSADGESDVYGGLLTVLLRLVFLLYAEDRGLMPRAEWFQSGYALIPLYERLRAKEDENPNLLSARYGAYGQLVALFRLVHRGAVHGKDGVLPAREGVLFDPDAYPFLEGRPPHHILPKGDRWEVPAVTDKTVLDILEALLVIDGERVSYRALDVEQIGSVYEAMMGFALHRATGPTVVLKGAVKGGLSAEVGVDLQALLAKKADDRVKHLKDELKANIPAAIATAIKASKTLDAITSAFLEGGGKRASSGILSARVPGVLAAGDYYLHATEERRASGSHYTPRALTEPIVQKTLAPVLQSLREARTDGRELHAPLPEQALLRLTVCDPAMGSGAFLVAACRYLGDLLLAGWEAYGTGPELPLDGLSVEDRVNIARRKIAESCLYGVDKNRFAVELAKLSLWLVTLAKDEPFTFVDHALRCGDSLLGVGTSELLRFSYEPSAVVDAKKKKSIGTPLSFVSARLQSALREAINARRQIGAHSRDYSYETKKRCQEAAEEATRALRVAGDCIVDAYLTSTKDGERAAALVRHGDALHGWIDAGAPSNDPPQTPHATKHRPFHWELEFPEVFDKEAKRTGFDAIVGNPPFKGGISATYGMEYLQWLLFRQAPSHGNADLVAHFFRRAFGLLAPGGCFGLISTNTIAQGDTRESGLLQILKAGGEIYDVKRKYRWPGLAAVIVSIVHARRGSVADRLLDGQSVKRISAFLTESATDDSPSKLGHGHYYSVGVKIYGQGFVFDDGDPDANPMSVLASVRKNAPNEEKFIFEYIGGEEINSSPTQSSSRFVINLSSLSESELEHLPALRDIVIRRVKPYRDLLGTNPNNLPLRKKWWAFQAHRPELASRLGDMARTLVCSKVSSHLLMAWQPASRLISEKVVVFTFEEDAALALLQSRVHEIWARAFSSTMKNDLQYTPSDCFETFPFPADWKNNSPLNAAGKAYHEHRAALCVRLNEGLTAVYNRFHDPQETDPGIAALRALHAALDRAVLDAYGWTDLAPTPEFVKEDDGSEEEAETEWAPSKRAKREKFRLKWTESDRDAVFARLLDLNATRAAEEAKSAPMGKRGETGTSDD